MNNNTKARYGALTRADRRAAGKAGEVRKSKHAKVGFSADAIMRRLCTGKYSHERNP